MAKPALIYFLMLPQENKDILESEVLQSTEFVYLSEEDTKRPLLAFIFQV